MAIKKNTIHSVEYICSYCGKKSLRGLSLGRPLPGKCPRKQGDKPHSWRVNRKI
jgi:hypothetical protein